MAATPKRGLGKGLGALIPTESATNAPRPEAAQPTAMPSGGSAAATVAATYAELPLDAITPNPRQPRTVFDDEALAELVFSITEIGLLQPIVVRAIPGGSYELVAGERRLRASRIEIGRAHV